MIPPKRMLFVDWEARTPLDAFTRVRERLLFGPARAYAEDVLIELQAHPADVVAINIVLYGAMIAAEKAGVPTALLGTSGYQVPAPGLPPPRLGLLPARGPFGRLRDRVLGAVITRLFAQGLPALNAARSQFGLAPLAHPFEQLGHADRVLLLTSQATRLPPNVRYVGPQLDDPAQAQPWSSPWPAGDPDPLVVVSFSTSFQNQGAILQRVIDALDGMRVRAVVTLGPTLKQEQFHAPSNVVIRPSAPLERVSHGSQETPADLGLLRLCLPGVVGMLAPVRAGSPANPFRPAAARADDAIAAGHGLDLPDTGSCRAKGLLVQGLQCPEDRSGVVRPGPGALPYPEWSGRTHLPPHRWERPLFFIPGMPQYAMGFGTVDFWLASGRRSCHAVLSS